MVTELVQKMLDGDRRALAQLITLLEQAPDQIAETMQAVHPYTGRAYCVGVTGPPGAGKSTLVDGLVRHIRKKDLSVGVLAVDPTSPYSGGALLGDRIRMQRHYLDDGVYIRSMASRGVHGGVSLVTREAVRLLDAFGKDLVIVETVGVGQTELDVMDVADTVVVVLVPEVGDTVQTMKAGLLEIADILVVNKADREGAGRLVANLKDALSLAGKEAWWRPPIVSTQAHKGEGVEELYGAIEKHRAAMEETSRLSQRRGLRRRKELMSCVEAWFKGKLSERFQLKGDMSGLVQRVEEGEIDPYSAAREVIEPLNQASVGMPETKP